MPETSSKSDPVWPFSGLLFVVPAVRAHSPLDSGRNVPGLQESVQTFKLSIVPGSGFSPFWPVMTAGAMLSRNP